MTTAEIISIVIPSATAILAAGVILGTFKSLKDDVKDVKRMTLENTIAIARMQGAESSQVQEKYERTIPGMPALRVLDIARDR